MQMGGNISLKVKNTHRWTGARRYGTTTYILHHDPAIKVSKTLFGANIRVSGITKTTQKQRYSGSSMVKTNETHERQDMLYMYAAPTG